jgi:hypothetical protein
MNVKHSATNIEFYTPPYIIQPVKKVMPSGIAFDPASCDLANAIVGADRFATNEGISSLDYPWRERTVFLNPPGGLTQGQSNMQIWFNKLFEDWSNGRVREAIFLGFQLSVFRLCPQIVEESLPFVIPQKRIAFYTTTERLTAQAIALESEAMQKAVARHIARYVDSAEYDAKLFDKGLIPSMHPSQDNVVIYFPRHGAPKSCIDVFYGAFQDIAPTPRRIAGL